MQQATMENRPPRVFKATTNTLFLPTGAIPPWELAVIRWYQSNGTQVALAPLHGFRRGPEEEWKAALKQSRELGGWESVRDQCRELGNHLASAKALDGLNAGGLTLDPAWNEPETQIRWGVHYLGTGTAKAETLRVLSGLVPHFAKLGNLEAAALLEEVRDRLKLRDRDLADLRRDIKAAPKSPPQAGEAGRERRPSLADLGSIHKLHPAVDFHGNVMTIGFRVDLSDDGGGFRGVLALVISDGSTVRVELDVSEVEIGGLKYKIFGGLAVPHLNDRWSLKRLQALTSPVIRPQNLYAELKAAYHTYLDLPGPVYGLLAAWCVGSYFAHAFESFPYLFLEGPKESGKSKTLQVLAYTCFNGGKVRHITAPALGDSIEAQRGTVLIDQAEKISPFLVGDLADSYRKDGGKRRVVDTERGRSLLEFDLYGPKAFAAWKDIDPDLKDRCIHVPTIRTNRRLPDLDGSRELWAGLRDKLYRFVLTAFPGVVGNYKATPGDGTRLTDLWRPLVAVLNALDVDAGEIGAINDLFCASAKETRHELPPWEDKLFEALKGRAAKETGPFTMEAKEILNAMGFGRGGEGEPGPKWVGEKLRTYSLYQDKKRSQVPGPDGKPSRITVYHFDPGKVLDLAGRYQREDTTPDRPGQAGQTPENEVCPGQDPVIAGEIATGQTGQAISEEGIEIKNDTHPPLMECSSQGEATGPDPTIPLCRDVECPQFWEEDASARCCLNDTSVPLDNPVCKEQLAILGWS